MKFTAALVATVAVAANALPTAVEYQGMFSAWSQEHGKTYEGHEIFQRFENFKANDAKITKHNAGNDTWFMRHNQFSDLDEAEFRARHTGFKSVTPTHTISGDNVIMPQAAVDWRAKGAVTPVKDQGQCGSCWAFSATGSIEGAVALATGTLTSLSEQELSDCAGSYGNAGCNGGLMDSAFRYVQAKGGLATEEDYPYTGRNGSCRSDVKRVSPITGFSDVNSESGLAAAIANGPVSLAVDAGAYQLYGGGVLSACSGRSLDHGVLLVAFDGSDTWTIKNSWGTGWGESGFIRVPYGQDCCGMANQASQPRV